MDNAVLNRAKISNKVTIMGNGGTKFSSGKIVFPGEKLCVLEEFMPGEGTFEINGNVYSKLVGRVLYDFVSRKVSVMPLRKVVNIPKQGMVVYAVVSTTKDDVAFTRIFSAEKGTVFSGTFTGILHVSQISNNYVKVVTDAIKVGDIVKAKVLTSWNPFQLTTKGTKLGVIYALCSKCGTPLVKRRTKLQCPHCGNVESRKISSDYMLSGGKRS